MDDEQIGITLHHHTSKVKTYFFKYGPNPVTVRQNWTERVDAGDDGVKKGLMEVEGSLLGVGVQLHSPQSSLLDKGVILLIHGRFLFGTLLWWGLVLDQCSFLNVRPVCVY